MRLLVIGGLLAGFLAVVGCISTPAPSPSGPPAGGSTCQSVSDLELYPYADNSEFEGFGLARAGPIWFSAFGPVHAGPASLADYVADGSPTKVVIHADPTLAGTAVLTGIECTSGAALHFCYDQPDNCGLVGANLTPDQLAKRGFDHVTINRRATDYTGYMLFPRAGLYRLVVKAADRELGAVTLSVGRF